MRTYSKIILVFSSCFLLILMYYTRHNLIHWRTINFINLKHKKLVTKHIYGNDEFLIKTPGCSLPDYARNIHFTSTKTIKGTCGPRAIFIKHAGTDKLVFQIDNKIMKTYVKKNRKISCCYRFGTPLPGTSDFGYSKCISFQNGQKCKHLQEVITVTCKTRVKKSVDIVYEDSYIMIKKINKKNQTSNHSWNILVLGMSTMSRARINVAMPHTLQYLLTNKWLDFKGYHTVGDEIFPNVMSILTGRSIATVNSYCATDLHKCNEMFIWRQYKNAGYITAFGDDYYETPNVFPNDSIKPPSTDHCVWPYFHAKYRRRKGNFFCTHKEQTGKQLLDYAYQFVDAYKTNNFFGMFWINSYSNRLETMPSLIDDGIVDFFKKINKTGILKNTFILFLSDHGMNFGDNKTQKEFYYERRLPIFFMWVPYQFQSLHTKEFKNMKINQNRLLSPQDVYSTMVDILKFPNITYNTSSEECPECTGLFKEKSAERKCADAGVDDEWCACHILEDTDDTEERVSQSITLVANHIQYISNTINTIPCMTCTQLYFKNVLRTHTYRDNDKLYYVILLIMSPRDIVYEARVLDDGKELTMVSPIVSITRHGRGNCAIDPKDRMFCICDITSCSTDLVMSLYRRKGN